MKKGDIVTIYEDPITCEKSEGSAKLVKYHRGDRHFSRDWHLEDWTVEFVDEPGSRFERAIKVSHEKY